MNIFQKLFGNKEEKSVGTWVTISGGQTDILSTTNYLTSWAKICLDKRAEVGADFKTYLYQNDREIETHEFLSAINKSNIDGQSWFTFNYLLWQSLDIYGRAFIYVVRNNKGHISNFVIMPTNRMTFVFDKNNINIVGYKYLGLTQTIFTKEEIIYINIPSIDAPLYGVGMLSNVSNLIKVDNLQQTYEKTILENFGLIGMAVSTDATLTEEQRLFYTKIFNEKYSGADKAGKTAFFDSGFKVNNVNANMREKGITEETIRTRDDILARFRVPKPVLGITDEVNYANAREATKTFLNLTIKPYSKFIVNAFDNFITSVYGEGYHIVFEYPDYQDEEIYYNAADRGAITINEYREGFNWDSIEGGDVLFAPKSLQTISGSTNGTSI